MVRYVDDYNARNWRATSAKTAAQSPAVGWRNSRIAGYQGESARPSSQRQSGAKCKQRPDRLAHCTRQVNDRCVDRDYQVEVGEDRGGIGEVADLRAQLIEGE
jgi:hypothetical protein